MNYIKLIAITLTIVILTYLVVYPIIIVAVRSMEE